MKTVIYFNVTTGDAFDKDGSLRTSNNPFLISCGEHLKTEWHLVAGSSPDTAPEDWQEWTEWETVPSFAFAAADDNYRSAYGGTLKNAADGGDTSLEIVTDAPAEEIAPTGTLRLTGENSAVTELAYTSFHAVQDGFSFDAEVPAGSSFPAGARADIAEEPLVGSGAMIQEESDPSHGVFSLELNAAGWRLARKMEFTDTALLEAKGLELCVGGVDPVTNADLLLFRCSVPFAIRGVICPGFYTIPDPANLSLLQQWTLALFAAGTEISYRDGQGQWSSASAGATAFRWRISGISGMPWSPAIPLEKYDVGKQICCSFEVAESNVLEVRILLSRIEGAAGPFRCGIFKVSGNITEDITNEVSVSFTGTEIVIGSQTAFPTGNYKIIG